MCKNTNGYYSPTCPALPKIAEQMVSVTLRIMTGGGRNHEVDLSLWWVMGVVVVVRLIYRD